VNTNPLATTPLRVPELGLGAGPLGDRFGTMGEEEAQAILRTALANGLTLIDTAPYYGLGLSEHRVGRFVRSIDRKRVVVATKVGRLLNAVPAGGVQRDTSYAGGLNFNYRFDYGYDAVMRSYEDSLQRMGFDRIDMLAIHDLDLLVHTPEEFAQNLRQLDAGGGARALQELRATRAVTAIGLGINTVGAIPRVLEIADLDYAIIALPYTLIDQASLDEDLPLCLRRQVSVVIGAPFAGGHLVSADQSTMPPAEGVDRAVHEKLQRIWTVCQRYDVPLGAAALQFPLAHPSVVAVIPGALTAAHVRENVERFKLEIPTAFWRDLKDQNLLREDAPVPAALH
jgi:D-threo-aldose 1-dehydrogenase